MLGTSSNSAPAAHRNFQYPFKIYLQLPSHLIHPPHHQVSHIHPAGVKEIQVAFEDLKAGGGLPELGFPVFGSMPLCPMFLGLSDKLWTAYIIMESMRRSKKTNGQRHHQKYWARRHHNSEEPAIPALLHTPRQLERCLAQPLSLSRALLDCSKVTSAIKLESSASLWPSRFWTFDVLGSVWKSCNIMLWFWFRIFTMNLFWWIWSSSWARADWTSIESWSMLEAWLQLVWYKPSATFTSSWMRTQACL